MNGASDRIRVRDGDCARHHRRGDLRVGPSVPQAEAAPDGLAKVEVDEVPFRPGAFGVTRPGDVWCLDHHRLICGDDRDHDVTGRRPLSLPANCVER